MMTAAMLFTEAPWSDQIEDVTISEPRFCTTACEFCLVGNCARAQNAARETHRVDVSYSGCRDVQSGRVPAAAAGDGGSAGGNASPGSGGDDRTGGPAAGRGAPR